MVRRLPHTTLRKVATVKANEMKPMKVDATDMGESSEFFETLIPILHY